MLLMMLIITALTPSPWQCQQPGINSAFSAESCVISACCYAVGMPAGCLASLLVALRMVSVAAGVCGALHHFSWCFKAELSCVAALHFIMHPS
jgi:hypothetical protein